MGGKTDITKYATELPTLFVWDADADNDSLKDYKELALISGDSQFLVNQQIATSHKNAIIQDLDTRRYPKVANVDWQANNNVNSNGSPADIVFVDHPVGGVSVKYASTIIGNFGTRDFDSVVNRPRGQDLFRFLAPEEFQQLVDTVKQNLLGELEVGTSWTRDGKYSISRIDQDLYRIAYGSASKLLTEQEIMRGEKQVKDKVKPIPSGCYRVIGDYYQENKVKFKTLRKALYNKLVPQIKQLVEQTVLSDRDKLCRLGGFTPQPYYMSDLKSNKLFYVPGLEEVKGNVQVAIVDKDKEMTFGSGFELGCEVRTHPDREPALIDFYICYNGGTFKRGPVIKIQNLQYKENLWTPIEVPK